MEAYGDPVYKTEESDMTATVAPYTWYQHPRHLEAQDIDELGGHLEGYHRKHDECDPSEADVEVQEPDLALLGGC